MSQLIPASFGAVSTKFATAPVADDLSSGIQSSFGLVGYKGKVWSIRYRGDEKQLLRDDGDGPRGSIEVVILKSSTNISKIWYEQGYVEGSNAAPDCFSNNGIAPEPTSAKKQCDSCAVCPHNQWGSRITPAGKQGKACADSKRLAVVPLADLNNEMFGGPMLLRVPAASLQDVAMYGQKMQQMGYPYYSIGTRIAFDPNESYPKFLFSAIRPLSDAEADIVLALRDGHTTQRILSENEFVVPAPAANPASVFEQPPVTPQVTASATVGDAASAAAAQLAALQAQLAAQKAALQAQQTVAADPAAALQAQLAALQAQQAEAQKAATEKAEKEAAEKVATEKAEKAAKAAAAKAAKAAKEAAEKAEKEAAEKAAAQTAVDPNDPVAALQAQIAALQAQAAAAAQATQPVTSQVSADPIDADLAALMTEAPAEDPAVAGTGSAFEKDLDAMLAELIPNN